MPESNYIVHYRNLKFYTALGLEITKTHKILEFEQSRWIKPYIEFNTKKRQEEKNPFEKDLFKLMNNSFYGKTLQNNRRHLDVRIVTTERKAKKLIARQTFQTFIIINEDVTVVKLTKRTVFWTNRYTLACVFLTYLKYTCTISTTTISCLYMVRGSSYCPLILIV